MSIHDSKPSPGKMVVVTRIPPGLLDDLPQEDQNAIVAIVGEPVLLVEYGEGGRAELHFDNPFDGRATHSIWVAPEFIETASDVIVGRSSGASPQLQIMAVASPRNQHNRQPLRPSDLRRLSTSPPDSRPPEAARHPAES